MTHINNNSKRSFKGVWIPSEIWMNTDLSVMEKVFLTEIDSLDNELGCFAGNKYFSEFFNISKGRCTQIIKGLEDRGYLSVQLEYKEDSKQILLRRIKVNKPYLENAGRVFRNGRYPYLENAEDNNTSFNNPNNKEPIPPEKSGGDKDPLEKISPEVIEFVKTFNGYIDDKFGKSAPRRTDKSFVADCNTIRLAMSTDKFSLDDIKSSLRWAHGDSFWQDQIKSLAQIRKKGTDGTSKLQKIYDKSKQIGNVKNKINDIKGIDYGEAGSF